MWCYNPSWFLAAILFVLARFSLATPVFTLEDTYIGLSFFENFDFSTFDDPTHGRVNFVSQEEARQSNLSYASYNKFVMRADHMKKVQSSERGRDSVRIQSRAAYADSLIVLDLTHMPEGCATWPAFWTISTDGNWPQGGEIDIIEGVNKASSNLASLHTTSNCTMPNSRPMTGRTVSTNCDAHANSNQGCGVSSTKANSYGSSFNVVGGGWYVMKRTAQEGISVWFWSRNDYRVPPGVVHGDPELHPDQTWGQPDAYFPFTTCSADHFDQHAIIFDLTLCGDWAGAVYGTSGCPSTCVDFVDNNPEAFVNAYWEINALRVYTPATIWNWH